MRNMCAWNTLSSEYERGSPCTSTNLARFSGPSLQLGVEIAVHGQSCPRYTRRFAYQPFRYHPTVIVLGELLGPPKNRASLMERLGSFSWRAGHPGRHSPIWPRELSFRSECRHFSEHENGPKAHRLAAPAFNA